MISTTAGIHTTTAGIYKTTAAAEAYTIKYHQPNCKCCGRKSNHFIRFGNRGLCEGCDESIPKHIPEEQYLLYMKELWRKK